MSNTQDWVTPSEAAAELRVTPQTIRSYIADGRLPAYRVSQRVTRIDRQDLDALVASVRSK